MARPDCNHLVPTLISCCKQQTKTNRIGIGSKLPSQSAHAAMDLFIKRMIRMTW